MDYLAYVKEKLYAIIKDMNHYHWLFCKNPASDFSRKEKWSFEKTMHFILTVDGN